MTERARQRVEEALQRKRHAERTPEIRELEAAIEDVLRRAPRFEGEQEAAIRVGIALANVECRLMELSNAQHQPRKNL